jgi:hypothetical protein
LVSIAAIEGGQPNQTCRRTKETRGIGDKRSAMEERTPPKQDPTTGMEIHHSRSPYKSKITPKEHTNRVATATSNSLWEQNQPGVHQPEILQRCPTKRLHLNHLVGAEDEETEQWLTNIPNR